MKKTSGMGRQCAAALGLALLLGTATIPAAYADGETLPVVVISAAPTTDPGTVPTADPGAVPTADPGAVPTADPGAVPTADPGAVPTADPGAVPTADPGTLGTELTPVQTAANTGVLPAPVNSTILVPPLNSSAVNSESVPATDEATPTPAPSTSSEASATAVPIALPEPVSKTIDAVVATASGSPLYVQLLTVLVLIGAGMAYFRVLGSKGTRVPSKSVK